MRLHELLAPYGAFGASCEANGVNARSFRNRLYYHTHKRAGAS
jgi:hypothetical protein